MLFEACSPRLDLGRTQANSGTVDLAILAQTVEVFF